MKSLHGVATIAALASRVCLAQGPEIVPGTLRIYGNGSVLAAAEPVRRGGGSAIVVHPQR